MTPYLQNMIVAIKENYGADFSQRPELQKFFSLKTLDSEKHWVRAGEQAYEFCFVVDGLMRVYYVDEKGQEANEGFYEEGRLLGPISSLTTGEACLYNIQALEPTTILCANYQRFHAFAQDKPDLLNFEISFLQSLYLHTAKRDAKRLLNKGEQRYRWFCREYPHLLNRLPQYHIASFLGMTAVSLSRLRQNLSQGSAR